MRVGVPEEERAQPQRVVCNVTLLPKSTERYDDIAATVDYTTVAGHVREIAGVKSFKLIETLAEEIARGITRHFCVEKATVEVRKFVLPDASFVSVTASCGDRE